ncbi:MAG: VanZ family protein [Chloroflexi bacterium]|nr:VanZ family protein [Chloroflexota bacterium]
MKKLSSIVPRWLPALLVMLVIFAFSSRPSEDLPYFLGWDYFIKKSSHVVGYGLLALSYLHLFNSNKKQYWLAWLFTVLYSATDEFHQSFVPGRHPALTDVLIFDNLGALFALSSHYFYRRTHEKEDQPT